MSPIIQSPVISKIVKIKGEDTIKFILKLENAVKKINYYVYFFHQRDLNLEVSEY